MRTLKKNATTTQQEKQNFASQDVSKAFEEICTLKARLVSSQTQYNQLESNHFTEMDRLTSINEELINKMREELSELKREKMQLLTQTQKLLSRNQELKKEISHFKVKEHARSQEDSAIDFWRENLEKVSIEKKQLERKIEEHETKESNYKLALKRVTEFTEYQEKEWDNKWKQLQQSQDNKYSELQKRIADDEIAKLHLAAIIIR